MVIGFFYFVKKVEAHEISQLSEKVGIFCGRGAFSTKQKGPV